MPISSRTPKQAAMRAELYAVAFLREKGLPREAIRSELGISRDTYYRRQATFEKMRGDRRS